MWRFRRRNYARAKRLIHRYTEDNINECKKLVVRYLPPMMTETEFRDHITPFPEHEYFYFCEPDWSLGPEATSRVHITFKNSNDIDTFISRFHGHVFVDSKGTEYKALVERSPFQGNVESKFIGKDSWVNTIDNEPHYQDFIARLKTEEEQIKHQSHNKIEFNFERKKMNRFQSTPLLEYLAEIERSRREYQKKWLEDKRLLREEEIKYYIQLRLANIFGGYQQLQFLQEIETAIEQNAVEVQQIIESHFRENFPVDQSKQRFVDALRHQNSSSRRKRKKRKNEIKFRIILKKTESAKKEEPITKQSENSEQLQNTKVDTALQVHADNTKNTARANANADAKIAELKPVATTDVVARKTCGPETGAIPKQKTQQSNSAGERRICKKGRFYKEKCNRQILTRETDDVKESTLDVVPAKKEGQPFRKVKRYSGHRY
ncbi:regulator of nonsense transcripts 3B-like [Teleopsis dalmanni]|uniref:regulator of nonsense transcripts 3B-like n=1 Tax=Teleopsis dalmanni TaxID=139649 RepID=UPI0018CDCC16|nr:regulator of nonsense transcripts 3B-like [Teleopsis dalmanni]XP_037939733.1 regulator of nonsense transcripts 3B-like [Teleopsis dalmanni]